MSDCLPVELMDIILGHLHPEQWLVSWPNTARNKLNLAACSLVSRRWNAVTRRHLFEDVVYSFRRVPADDEASHEALTCEHDVYRRFSMGSVCEARYKTLRLFCQFLRSDEVARTSIRRLRLRVLPSARRISSFGSTPRLDLCFDEQDRVESAELVALFGLLPNLRVLHLSDIIPSTPSCASWKTIRLRQLSIDFSSPFYQLRDRNQYTTYSEYAVVQLLTFFGEVEDLQIARVGFDHSSSYPILRSTQSSPLRVRSLTLCMTQSYRGCLLDSLTSSVTLPDLRRLVLKPHDLSAREVHLLQNALSPFSGNLLELKYDLSRTNFFHATVPVLDISRCNKLHQLNIGFRLDPHTRYTNIDTLRNIASFLSEARISQTMNPQLRAITFEITFVFTLEENSNWQLCCHEGMNAFDCAVSELASRYPILKLRFEYKTIGRFMSQSPADTIANMMSITSQRVKLHIQAYGNSEHVHGNSQPYEIGVDEFL